MNKTEFIASVAEKSGMNKKDTAAVVEASLETIREQLAKGDAVSFIGFGTFDVKNVPAREGRNPATGQTIQIPAKKKPVFKAGKALSDALNK